MTSIPIVAPVAQKAMGLSTPTTPAAPLNDAYPGGFFFTGQHGRTCAVSRMAPRHAGHIVWIGMVLFRLGEVPTLAQAGIKPGPGETNTTRYHGAPDGKDRAEAR